MPRYFKGFDGLAKGLLEAAIIHQAAVEVGMDAVSVILEKNVKAGYGSHALPPLAQVTIDERTALNLSPDDPLLRTGALLRASVERTHRATSAAVGSSKPIALFSEVGSVNVPRNTTNPPRPVFQTALYGSKPEIEAVVADVLAVTFGESRKTII